MKEVIALWTKAYWDGPISGMALLDGKRVWFHMVDKLEPDYERVYGIYKLTDEDQKLQEEIHADFNKYVGYHHDHGDNYAPYNGSETKHIFLEKYEGGSNRPTLFEANKICQVKYSEIVW